MIDEIREEIEKHLNNNVVLKVYVGRNKYEIYEGTIKEVYPSLFLVKLKNEIKTFTYSDILTKSVVVKYL